MKKHTKLPSTRCFLAVVAGLAASSLVSPAQGLLPSATLVGTAGTGDTFDYTLTLNNGAAATSSLEGLWYAWIPGAFYLPSAPSSASGAASGWTATIKNNSIQFQGSAGDAIAPGGSDSFTFVTTDSPATLAGDTGGGVPIGTSYAYPGTISGNVAGADAQEFVVQSVPEPSSLGLLVAGSLCFAAVGGRMIARGAAKATA
jgi:hypothetical protein